MKILLPGTNPSKPHAAPVYYTSWLSKVSNPHTSHPATPDRSCTHVSHSVPSRSDTNLVCSFGALTNTVTGTPTRDPACPFGVLHITTKTTSVYSASLCPLVPRSNSTRSLMTHRSSELKMHTQKNKLRSHSIQGSSQHSAQKVHHGQATTRSRSAPLPTGL